MSVGRSGRRFAFSYSFSTTRPRFARANILQRGYLLELLVPIESRTSSNLIEHSTNFGTLPRTYAQGHIVFSMVVPSKYRRIVHCQCGKYLVTAMLLAKEARFSAEQLGVRVRAAYRLSNRRALHRRQLEEGHLAPASTKHKNLSSLQG